MPQLSRENSPSNGSTPAGAQATLLKPRGGESDALIRSGYGG